MRATTAMQSVGWLGGCGYQVIIDEGERAAVKERKMTKPMTLAEMRAYAEEILRDHEPQVRRVARPFCMCGRPWPCEKHRLADMVLALLPCTCGAPTEQLCGPNCKYPFTDRSPMPHEHTPHTGGVE